MRVALISDIHGHGTALDAVLEDMARDSVDSVICLGDVATVGPQPRDVLARLRDLGCACIMGNHDAALLAPERALEYQIAPLLLPSLQWCAGQLTREDLDCLQSFRPVIQRSLGTHTTLKCFHGSPRSMVDVILATTPAGEIDRLFAEGSTAIMAGGHTHIQMLRQHAGTLIVNPGSVGSAFRSSPGPDTTPTLLPWAEYGIVDWVNGRVSVDLRRVPFDLAAFSEVVSKSDIPIRDWWLQQYAATEPGDEG